MSLLKDLKHQLFGLGVLARYGTFYPREVSLAETGHLIAVDPQDQRAWRKIILESVRGRVSTPMMFWRDHVARHRGGLYLDVGANYGECAAHGDYPAGYCIAVEANSNLIPYLEQTRQLHADRDRIVIANALVDREPAESASLWFAPIWTGGGSAVASAPGLSEVVVPAKTLQQIVESLPLTADAPLVMKMDVEGHEARALEGFPGLFERPAAVGILEFDTEMLGRAGSDPQAFFSELARHFEVYLTTRRSRTLMKLSGWRDLCEAAGSAHFHRDLVFARTRESICPGWLS